MFGMIPFERNDDMFDLFDNFERNFFGNSGKSLPDFRTDIRDIGDAFVLEAELPGFDKEDIHLDLKDGVLTVKGYGDTRDFSCDTAPFAEYADEIRTLVIEDGITYIGSCLFYGLGGLQGELILPESIVGIGDYAFSGDGIVFADRTVKPAIQEVKYYYGTYK